MNLNEMTIKEKIVTLESLLAKAKSDLDYSFSVRWGQDKEAAMIEMRTFIANAKELFLSGRLTEYEIQNSEASITWNQQLDYKLCQFPEFYLQLEQDEAPKL